MKRPSAELLELFADAEPGVTTIALGLREMVLAEAPGAEEVLYQVYAKVIVFQIPNRKGGAFCGVVAYARHVNLMFYNGTALPDHHRLLEGTGKKMRHIKFLSPDDLNALRRERVRDYIQSAIELVPDVPKVASTRTKKAAKQTVRKQNRPKG